MPPELKEFLEREAKRNGRSLNAEIVARLQASKEAAERMAEFDPNDPLKTILLSLQGLQQFEKAIAKAVLLAKAKYEGTNEDQ